MMKKLRLLIVFAMLILSLAGCKKENVNSGGDSTEKPTATSGATPTAEPTITPQDGITPTDEQVQKETVRIAALKGPTAIGMVQVMDKNGKDETVNNYEFTIAGAADEISTGLIKGDFDMAAVPCNLASVLFNKTEGKIQLAGINTLSVLYIVETGEVISSMEDLKGKTIYSTGLGTTPQYTLNYLLSSYGIDPAKDVTIEYKTEATEVAALLSGAKDAIAMLPQPYVTTVMMNNSSVRIALDVAEEWNKANKDESSIVTGVIVVNSEFLKSNKDVVDAFMEEYVASAQFVNDNVEEAATLVEQFGIFNAAVAKQAIPYCNITLIQGEEMKSMVKGYLTTLYEQNPNSIGGALPTDEFYYIP